MAKKVKDVKKKEKEFAEITSLRLGELRPEIEEEAKKQTRTITSLLKHYIKRGLEADRQTEQRTA